MVTSSQLVALTLSLSAFGLRVVVDDASPAWTFQGSDWNVITPSTPCSSCLIKPDPTQAYNHTWHDTIGHDSGQLAFNGISIELYIICDSTWSANYTFTLDSASAGVFIAQSACTGFAYNYLVYGKANLTLGPHTIGIANLDGSALLLDYAIYDDGTVVTPPAVTVHATSTVTVHTRPSIAPLVALGVVAGLSLLVIMVLLLLFKSRTSQMRQVQQPSGDPRVGMMAGLPGQFTLLPAASPAVNTPTHFGGYTGAPIIMSPLIPGNATAAMVDTSLLSIPTTPPLMSFSRTPNDIARRTDQETASTRVIPTAHASSTPQSPEDAKWIKDSASLNLVPQLAYDFKTMTYNDENGFGRPERPLEV